MMNLINYHNRYYFNILLCVYTLVSCFSSIASTNNSTYNKEKLTIDHSYCKQQRHERTKKIQNNPNLNDEYAIHLLTDASCFTVSENLYFAAIKEAQHKLTEYSSWQSEKKNKAKEQAEKKCLAQKEYKNNVKALATCKQSEYENSMEKLHNTMIQGTTKHLNKRAIVAKELFLTCVQSLSNKTTLLPQDIKLPIALYLPTNRSITNKMFNDNQDDKEWLLELRNRSYKDDLRDILKDACPGEMVYWIDKNISIDIVNLYKRD